MCSHVDVTVTCERIACACVRKHTCLHLDVYAVRVKSYYQASDQDHSPLHRCLHHHVRAGWQTKSICMNNTDLAKQWMCDGRSTHIMHELHVTHAV